MDIAAVIQALKDRTQSTFAGRVAGAAEYKRLPETANMDMPAAFVIPLDDVAEQNKSENSYRQAIVDGFAVVVVVDNTADERGQASISVVRTYRPVLCQALLRWCPDAEHGPIDYGGGLLMDLDRARLYYQFEFSAPTELDESDTYQATANAALTAFDKVAITIDEPAGTTEVTATVPVPQV